MKKSKQTKKAKTDQLAENIKITEKKTSGSNLKLDHAKDIASKIILGIIILLAVIFIVKTKVWEISYYSEKEGSIRNPIINVDPDAVVEVQTVDETEVTEAQRAAHVVAPSEPRYLTIEKLGIHNARIISVGLTKDGAIDTPYSIFDVGWYSRSGKPGSGNVIVIDGHNGGPTADGVFKKLNQLYNDDIITIERGDGTKFTYKVVENMKVSLAEADDYMSTAFTSPIPGTESLTLISCIGEWSQTQQTYLSRQFVRAVLVKQP